MKKFKAYSLFALATVLCYLAALVGGIAARIDTLVFADQFEAVSSEVAYQYRQLRRRLA